MDYSWESSAEAWIALQGEQGDTARRLILDPAIEPFFLNVAGMRILDVGCGEGRYCRKLAAKGALVTGIDPTIRFIEQARALDPSGDYRVASATELPFEVGSFDTVLSYLSLIDIEDDEKAIAEMCRVLEPGGKVVVVTIANVASTSDGWVKDGEGSRLYRTVDRYMESFELELSWGGLNIINYHRPLSKILGQFFARGLVMTHFLEPLPPTDSEHYADEVRVPTFQVFVMQS